MPVHMPSMTGEPVIPKAGEMPVHWSQHLVPKAGEMPVMPSMPVTEPVIPGADDIPYHSPSSLFHKSLPKGVMAEMLNHKSMPKGVVAGEPIVPGAGEVGGSTKQTQEN